MYSVFLTNKYCCCCSCPAVALLTTYGQEVYQINSAAQHQVLAEGLKVLQPKL